MAKKARPEEIIAKQREVEVRIQPGETTGQTIRAIGVTANHTRYRDMGALSSSDATN